MAVCVVGNAAVAPVGRVAELIRGRGLDVDVPHCDSADDVRRAVQRSVDVGIERVVAVGGDGVVHLAIQAVAGSGTVLGIVPHGTGNDFARAVGLLGGRLEERVARAMAAPSPVDALRTTHGWVASVATLGFSGDVTARANAMRWPRGRARYTLATLRQLPRLRILDVNASIDGVPVVNSSTLLAIGNTAFFGGGMRICPDATPQDGVLQLVSIDAVPRRTFLRVFPTVFSGAHVRRGEVTVASGKRVVIDGADGIDVWADGEHLGPLPIELEIAPAALSVAGAVTG